MRDVVLIAHNLRSCHNVGSLLRTADGLGVARVFLTGYTPYPMSDNDSRLPHESRKLHNQIAKAALGAENFIAWENNNNILNVITELRDGGFTICAIEQTPMSISLPDFIAPNKIALIVGREVEGIEEEVIALCDDSLEIPMLGQKESFNVAQAAAIALYHCTFV